MIEHNVYQMPIKTLTKEAVSQKDKIVKEVMDCLYSLIPDPPRESSFHLSDGKKCFVKKFHPPRFCEESGYIYGFDVKFVDESPLVHLEFSVKCSGWERAF